MIRTRTWKLVWNATDVDELYRLSDDPDELQNLIDEPKYAAVVADLRSRLAEELIAQGDRILDNPWLRDQLGRSRKLSRSELGIQRRSCAPSPSNRICPPVTSPGITRLAGGSRSG